MTRVDRDRWREVSPYLDRALELSGAERDSWLESLRATHPALAAEVAMLLDRSRALEDEGFLAGAAAQPAGGSLAGQVVGAYTLRALIGHGGMGSVWLAERSDGRFQGVAAVKLLNASLVGRDGEARFRREVSILGRLRHPHIAHLIDAGLSTFGHPYLVLEHVDGERIDTYCDARRLGIEARIRLFLDVLAAVGHAHANLVVHRDIKPSNVLVAGDGRVKLLDFGIARLLEGEGGEDVTALTLDGAAALTPEYAAPEQLTGGDVTTATDVYALGALLYVLLAGQHPARARASTPAELVRAIVDWEAPRLSDAARVAADTRPETAAQRATTPKKLRSLLRGDLDNIVAKALRKLPAQRYASVEPLAEDLRRYLGHEPVSARADSLAYRTARFLRRHRLGASAAVLLVVSLAVGLSATAWQAARARRAARRAEAVTEFLIRLFELSNPLRPQSAEVTTRQLLDRGVQRLDADLSDQPELRASLLGVMGRVHASLGLYEPAATLLEQTLALRRQQGGDDEAELARVLSDLASVRSGQGDYARAAELAGESLGMQRRIHGADHPDIAVTLDRLALALLSHGRHGEAEPLLRQALEMRRRLHGNAHRDVVSSLIHLGNLFHARGDYAAAEPHYREALSIARSLPGDSYPTVPWSMATLAAVHTARGQTAEAVTLLRESLRLFRQRLGSEHPELAQFMRSLATALKAEGQAKEAAELYAQVLAIERASLGAEHHEVAKTTFDLAVLLHEQGRFDEAETHYRQCVNILLKLLPPDHPHIGRASSGLAALLNDQHRYAEAESLFRPAVAILEKGLPPGHDLTAAAQAGLGRALTGQRRSLAEAQGLLERASAAYRAKFGAADPRTAAAVLSLGECMFVRGKRQEAGAAVEASLPILVRAYGEEDARTRRARQLAASTADRNR